MSNADNKDMPAQPTGPIKTGQAPNELWLDSKGLTKREYAAIHIMAGISANGDLSAESVEQEAKWAVASADAVLKKLDDSSANND